MTEPKQDTAASPNGSALSDLLGPLPERRIRHVYNESKGYECDCWAEDAVREYALCEAQRLVAAERARCLNAAAELRRRLRGTARQLAGELEARILNGA